MIVFAMSPSAFAEKVTVLLGMWVDCSGGGGRPYRLPPLFLNYFLESLSSLWHTILIWGAKHCLVCWGFFCARQHVCVCVCASEMCSKVRCEAAVMCRACRRVCVHRVVWLCFHTWQKLLLFKQHSRKRHLCWPDAHRLIRFFLFFLTAWGLCSHCRIYARCGTNYHTDRRGPL